MTGPILVWFRQDLRLADNPALMEALDQARAEGRPLVPVYILDDETAGPWAPGGASRWWLHHSLACLAEDLQARGSRLILRRGAADAVVPALVSEIGAAAVHWNRCYEPFAIARDARIKATLKADGTGAHSHNAALLFEPWTVKTKTGQPYRVYSPFWRACRALGPGDAPRPSPEVLPAPEIWPATDTLADWGLRPTAPDWAGGLRETWTPGEAGATVRLRAFLDAAVIRYKDQRDLPGIVGTSALSPHLHWGEIGPRQIWHAVAERQAAGALAGGEAQAETFLQEIVWREFSYNLLYHCPDLPEASLDARFHAFPWRDDPEGLRAWQRGQTGYPIVDAGMRALYHTGWMHNRVRMIVASFLVKHLLIHWRAGEDWFWDTLVDADLASNSASWQWVAGCGADAAPYFRVFNPTLQGEKFDTDGAYVRRWVPELAGLPDKYIHKPWAAPPMVLNGAEVTLGRTYPHPIVEHAAARKRALAAFDQIKQSVTQGAVHAA